MFVEEFLGALNMSNLNDEDNYTAGRRDEQVRQQDNANTQGLLIGLLIVLGIGGIAAALFLFNRNDTTVVPVVAPSTVPASPATSETTIIREKSTEVVPVPVPASPAQPNNINITVPSSEPSTSAMPSASVAPSTEPSAAAPSPASSPSASTTPVPASPSP